MNDKNMDKQEAVLIVLKEWSIAMQAFLINKFGHEFLDAITSQAKYVLDNPAADESAKVTAQGRIEAMDIIRKSMQQARERDKQAAVSARREMGYD